MERLNIVGGVNVVLVCGLEVQIVCNGVFVAVLLVVSGRFVFDVDC